MTVNIALEFITQILIWYTEMVPVLLVTLLIFKVLRLASGWQIRKHEHKIFDVG